MKRITAKLIVFLFVVGLIVAGVQSCSDDYGDYGDTYGGVTAQTP